MTESIGVASSGQPRLSGLPARERKPLLGAATPPPRCLWFERLLFPATASRNDSSYTKLAGRHAGRAFEMAREMALVGKAHRTRDLGQRGLFRSCRQQGARAVHSNLDQIPMR